MAWASQGGCTWSQPALGPYESNNRSIIRQHAAWLRDAAVDFVLVDWSNNIDYEPLSGQGLNRTDLTAIEDNTATVFEEFAAVNGAPKLAILAGSPANVSDYLCLPAGRLKEKADEIWLRFAGNLSLSHQYFLLDGKPLLVDFVGEAQDSKRPLHYRSVHQSNVFIPTRGRLPCSLPRCCCARPVARLAVHHAPPHGVRHSAAVTLPLGR